MNSNKKLLVFVVGFLGFSILLVAAYFGYGSLSLKYDNKKIDVCSIIKGDVSSKGNFISNFGTTDGSFDVVWNNTENVTADGVLFSIFAIMF